MSRLLGLLAAFALLAVAFPAGAAAAPGRLSSSRTLMYCELPSNAGPVTLSAEINDTETFTQPVCLECGSMTFGTGRRHCSCRKACTRAS